MFEEKPISKNLIEVIRTSYPNLSDNQIDDIADNLNNLGQFLIRLWLRQHEEQQKTVSSKDFTQETGIPP